MNPVKRVGLPLVALVLLAGAAGAADRVLLPEEMDLPWYALGLGHSSDGAWVGAVFYRPFDKAPGKLTVNEFVSVDPVEYPLCVEGFAVIEEGESFPITSVLWNRPNETVEIVLVPGGQYLAALAKDGKVTFNDMKKMDFVVWEADFYLEVNQPPDPAAPGEGFSRDVIASGVLEDGRPFYVRSVYTQGAYNIEFRVGD